MTKGQTVIENHSCPEAPTNTQGVVDYPHRDGSTYVHEKDGRRLAAQHHRVLAILRDGGWHTLAELSGTTKDPEASISARIRDLRKPRFGSYIVDRRRRDGRGQFEYRLRVGQLEIET